MSETRLKYNVYVNRPRFINITHAEGHPFRADYWLNEWDYSGGAMIPWTASIPTGAEFAIVNRQTGAIVVKRDNTGISPEVQIKSALDNQIYISVDLTTSTMIQVPEGRYDYALYAKITDIYVLVSGLFDVVQTHIEVSEL